MDRRSFLTDEELREKVARLERTVATLYEVLVLAGDKESYLTAEQRKLLEDIMWGASAP